METLKAVAIVTGSITVGYLANKLFCKNTYLSAEREKELEKKLKELEDKLSEKK